MINKTCSQFNCLFFNQSFFLRLWSRCNNIYTHVSQCVNGKWVMFLQHSKILSRWHLVNGTYFKLTFNWKKKRSKVCPHEKRMRMLTLKKDYIYIKQKGGRGDRKRRGFQGTFLKLLRLEICVRQTNFGGLSGFS